MILFNQFLIVISFTFCLSFSPVHLNRLKKINPFQDGVTKLKAKRIDGDNNVVEDVNKNVEPMFSQRLLFMAVATRCPTER